MRTILRSRLRVLGLLVLGMLSGQGVNAASFTPVIRCSVDGVPGCQSLAASAVWTDRSDLADGRLWLEIFSSVYAGFGNKTASVSIDATFWATTPGPVRPGFLNFTFMTDADGSFGGWKGKVQNVASMPGIGGCANQFACNDFGDVSFLLGVPFQVKLFSSIEMETLGEPVGWTNSAGVLLFLGELNEEGQFVRVPILAPVVVPEPGLFGTVMLAMCAGILWKLRRLITRWPSDHGA